jgi:quinol monooxygenase YgiN
MAPQLFVYYRVRAQHRAAAVAASRALHAAWRREDPGLECDLLQRVDSDPTGADLVTLMEVYRHAQGIAPARRQRIEREAQAALAAWLVGERHVEVFAPCA